MYQLAHFAVGVVKLKVKYRPVGNIVQILPEVEGYRGVSRNPVTSKKETLLTVH